MTKQTTSQIELELKHAYLVSLADSRVKSLKVAKEAGATDEQLKTLEAKMMAHEEEAYRTQFGS